MDIVSRENRPLHYQGDLVNPRLNEPLRDKGDLVPPENQRGLGQILNWQRRQNEAKQKENLISNTKNLTKVATTNPQSALRQAAKLALSMFRQIKAQDWPYLCLLLPLSFLKDIFDIAFAAIPGVGIIISFVTTLLLSISTIVFLILIGEKISLRRSAGLGVEFISEALPGIGWLPLAFIETLVIYFFVLFDRATNLQEQKEESSPSEPQYADNYGEAEQKAA
jgi:hypothetical protein